MSKFIQEFLDNLDFDFAFEIPDFPSGSDEEFFFPDDIEIF